MRTYFEKVESQPWQNCGSVFKIWCRQEEIIHQNWWYDERRAVEIIWAWSRRWDSWWKRYWKTTSSGTNHSSYTWKCKNIGYSRWRNKGRWLLLCKDLSSFWKYNVLEWDSVGILQRKRFRSKWIFWKLLWIFKLMHIYVQVISWFRKRFHHQQYSGFL